MNFEHFIEFQPLHLFTQDVGKLITDQSINVCTVDAFNVRAAELDFKPARSSSKENATSAAE